MGLPEIGRIGAVVIGRNEGERLPHALRSVLEVIPSTVYVDSASSDGSADRARSLGIDVVQLDPAGGLSAARARNRGAARLLERHPSIELIQFVDGDCVLVAGWLERAVAELTADAQLAVVCGRRRERERQASIYHRLYDIEWDAPSGLDQHCGGDALIRVAAFRSVNGYRAELKAGEEPELCIRLREAGWRVRRIAADMTVHDAGHTSFARWWQRARRAGFAFAQGTALHGGGPLRHWRRESLSIWFWGLALPLFAVTMAMLTNRRSLVVLLAYLILWWRIARRHMTRGLSAEDVALYATFCVLGKLPEALGQLSFQLQRWSPQPRHPQEYR